MEVAKEVVRQGAGKVKERGGEVVESRRSRGGKLWEKGLRK